MWAARIFSLAPSLITFMLVEHPVLWGLLLGPSPPRRLAAQVGSTRTHATCLRQHSKSVTARDVARANLPCGVPTHACTHAQLHAVSDLARVPRVTRFRSCNSIVLRLPHRARASPCSSARACAVCSGHAQRSTRRPAAKNRTWGKMRFEMTSFFETAPIVPASIHTASDTRPH